MNYSKMKRSQLTEEIETLQEEVAEPERAGAGRKPAEEVWGEE